MEKSIQNYKVSEHFFLYEFIESSYLYGNGVEMNWKYINSF